MLTIFWAFGAMVVLLGIISFLPLGLTLIGKIFVVLTGFVLALGGLAANSTFPLWTTYLMLSVLTFFAAYIMHSQMSKVLYTVDLQMEEEFVDEAVSPFASGSKEITDDVNLLDLSEIEQIPPSPLTKLKSNIEDDESLSLLEPVLTPQKDDDSEIIVEDISLIAKVNTDKEIVEEHNDSEVEVGYLSEIESLLLEDSGEEGWLDDLEDLEPIDTEGGKNSSGMHQLEKSELELIFSSKEVASGKEDSQIETIFQKKVELQK